MRRRIDLAREGLLETEDGGKESDRGLESVDHAIVRVLTFQASLTMHPTGPEIILLILQRRRRRPPKGVALAT